MRGFLGGGLVTWLDEWLTDWMAEELREPLSGWLVHTNIFWRPQEPSHVKLVLLRNSGLV